MSEQFKTMGVDIQPMVTDTATEDFEIMPINWPSVCTFLDCQTQWRALARGAELIWTGIEYASLDIIMRRLTRTNSDLDEDRIWRDVQHMERTALDVFNGVTS